MVIEPRSVYSGAGIVAILGRSMRYILDTFRHSLAGRRRQVIIAGIILVIGLLAALFAYNYYKDAPHIVYQPLKACDLFTLTDAHELLGQDVIGNVTDPTISGDTATSKCSYTDTNRIEGHMAIAAVAVRTGINDDGVRQNQADFVANEKANTTQKVKDVGGDAYFITAAGQLNILYKGNWYIISYGVGNSPADFTLDDALKVARYVLTTPTTVDLKAT